MVLTGCTSLRKVRSPGCDIQVHLVFPQVVARVMCYCTPPSQGSQLDHPGGMEAPVTIIQTRYRFDGVRGQRPRLETGGETETSRPPSRGEVYSREAIENSRATETREVTHWGAEQTAR